MPEDRANNEGFDLDRALTIEEREAWGPLVDATHGMRPSQEFARQLEADLRALAISPSLRPASMPTSGARGIEAPGSRRVFLPGRRSFRPAFVAATLALAMVLVMLVSLALRGSDRTSNPLAQYLPAGKVRHLVIEHTYSATGVSGGSLPAQPPVTTTQEIWLANGASHPIMYYLFSPIGKGQTQGVQLWVTEDAVYDYRDPYVGQVLKYPYNPAYANRYLPDPNLVNSWLNDKSLRAPAGHLIDHVTLDGRAVAEIATDPYTLPTMSGSQDIQTAVDRVWIDTQEHIMVKLHREITLVRGRDKGRVQTNEYHLIKDELLEQSALPPGFLDLRLPPGARVVDSKDPVANTLTPEASPAPTNTPDATGSAHGLLRKAAQAALDVPQGKIRHTAYSFDSNYSYPAISPAPPPYPWTDEVWLAKDGDHYLMRTDTAEIGHQSVLDKQYYWVLDPFASKTEVQRYPAHPGFITRYTDHLHAIVGLLSFSDVRMIGTEILDGHEVILLERLPDSLSSAGFRVWIDTATYQVRKAEQTFASGTMSTSSGDPVVYSWTLVKDETVDAVDYPANLFAFEVPQGKQVADSGAQNFADDPIFGLAARPLTLPQVQPGQSCPASTAREVAPGAPPLAGNGPIYSSILGTQVVGSPTKDGWYQTKGSFFGDLNYRDSPLLVRGARLDGPGAVRFQGAYDAPIVENLMLDYTMDARGPSLPEGWRAWHVGLYLPSPGCYAVQIDGTNGDGSPFTEVFTFEVTQAATPTPPPTPTGEQATALINAFFDAYNRHDLAGTLGALSFRGVNITDCDYTSGRVQTFTTREEYSAWLAERFADNDLMKVTRLSLYPREGSLPDDPVSASADVERSSDTLRHLGLDLKPGVKFLLTKDGTAIETLSIESGSACTGGR